MSVDVLRERVRALMPRAREDLARMVGFRSVFDPRTSPPGDCARMADFTGQAFATAGAHDVATYELSLIHI